jgi:hypothetical protein
MITADQIAAWGGASVRMYFATTPSDFRASRNIEAEIRRQLEGRQT